MQIGMQTKGCRRVSSKGLQPKAFEIGPLVFVPLTTPHRRLGALGMSGSPGTTYSSEDIGFLSLIGRVVAFAIDDNFNLRQAEAAQRELQRQNERLQRQRERASGSHRNDSGHGLVRQQQTAQAEFFNRRMAGLRSAYPRIRYKAGAGHLRFIRMI